MAIVAKATKIHKCKREAGRAGQGRQGKAEVARLRRDARRCVVKPKVMAKPWEQGGTEQRLAALRCRSYLASPACPALPCLPLLPNLEDPE